MTAIRFDLEPHQWPPHAQGEREGFADAVFSVEWDGKAVEVAARWVWLDKYRAILFFRALARGAIYVASHWMQLRFEPSFYYALNDEQKFKLISNHVKNALKGEAGWNYGHIVPPRPAHVAQWLFVTHEKTCAAWKDRDSSFFTPFRIDSEADLTPDAIDNPDSSAGFARRWSQLSHAERCERAVCFANANWKEFREIVRAAVYFGAPSFATQGLIISFSDEFRISESTSHFHPHSIYNSGVRLRRWGIYIADYFAPHRDQMLAARHLCVAEQLLAPLIQFELPQPTQHERLEAALLLREWAKGKVPEREARLLLPKL